ncbi:MAG: hypothetical protein VYA27_03605 [Verrucomicrobiota bacterium]|nr:hypothetical protein [Verrucomicrobiota bacterium]
MNWLIFALMTVACWGLYGIFLHAGQVEMQDKELGRYKAFLFVGIAYFITAVLAPLVVLLVNKETDWSMPGKGMWLSLFAGILGAAGAFCVLLAMASGAKGGMSPAVVAISVMSIIFCGAPLVNAIVSICMDRPEGGLAAIPWQFLCGILMAALGGFMVVKFKPAGSHGSPPRKPGIEAPAKE